MAPEGLTVMTYNVHSCTGGDGRDDPVRIARIIERHRPDVIALQELDSGLVRTGLSDQARLLADMLEMRHHFHPSLCIEAGRYGNAVLSPHPMRLFHAGELPTIPGRGARERRGAIWLKLDIGGREVEVFNTHLGLNRHERMAQAMALTGPEWLRHPECTGPVIFCGDLNATRWSWVYRTLSRLLADADRGRRRATWPSSFPVLRLDYVFTGPGLAVKEVVVPRDGLTRAASDHLPVLAVLEASPEERR